MSVPRETDDMVNKVSAGNLNFATFHSMEDVLSYLSEGTEIIIVLCLRQN